MAFSRYRTDSRIAAGTQLSTAEAVNILRLRVKSGTLGIRRTITLNGADRLDSLAGAIYGDAKYWWVLAAVSDIGWGMQVPPGTTINIVDLSDVERLVG